MDGMQYIFDKDGNPEFVVIPHDEFVRMEAVYEASKSDEELFDEAMAENEESFPAEVLDALLEGQNPIRVYRRYRGLKQKELAAAVGIQPVYLSQIETGVREGSRDVRRALASALQVSLDDLE